MDNYEIKRKLSVYDSALGAAKVRLEEAKKVEGKRAHLAALVRDSDALVAYLKSLLDDLITLNLVTGKEEVAFKKRRLGFLENKITEHMEYIFPRKKLRANISCNFDRRKMKLRLNIVDSEGNVRPPHKTEGKLAQQLISVTAAYGCTRLLGRNILYMDEPFANSSLDNLIKLQGLLEQFVLEDFQIILVSQSQLLFADLPRRVIRLRSSDGLQVDRVEYQDIDHLECD